MDAAIFAPARMGLRDEKVLSLPERVVYRPEDDLLYLNFEGLRLDTEQDAEMFARDLEAELASYGRRLDAVVNYDNFQLAPAAADRYWAMIRHNTARYLRSTTRYSTNAFFRLQLGERFADASLDGHLYRSFDDALGHLGE
jgi:propionate CoA-transferase